MVYRVPAIIAGLCNIIIKTSNTCIEVVGVCSAHADAAALVSIGYQVEIMAPSSKTWHNVSFIQILTYFYSFKENTVSFKMTTKNSCDPTAR